MSDGAYRARCPICGGQSPEMGLLSVVKWKYMHRLRWCNRFVNTESKADND